VFVAVANMQLPLDEGGTIQAHRFISSLNNPIILNWGVTNGKLFKEYAEVRSYKSIFFRYFSYFLFFMKSVFVAMKERPDVTYFFPLRYPNNIQQLQALMLNLFSKKFIEVLYQTPKPSFIFKVLTRFKLGLISKYAMKRYQAYGLDVTLVPLRHKEPKKYSRDNLRRQYGFNKDDFIVLHVGHVEKGRGLDVIYNLAKKNKDIKFLIVTSLRYDKKMNKIENLKVIPKQIDDIYEIYSFVDAYIFPLKSRYSAIDVPLTVCEAERMGLPLILSDIIDLREESFNNAYYIRDFNKEFVNIINKIRGK